MEHQQQIKKGTFVVYDKNKLTTQQPPLNPFSNDILQSSIINNKSHATKFHVSAIHYTNFSMIFNFLLLLDCTSENSSDKKSNNTTRQQYNHSGCRMQWKTMKETATVILLEE